MVNKKLIVGNLKMNMVADEISSYLRIVNKNIYSDNVVICPSSIYIPYFLKKKFPICSNKNKPAQCWLFCCSI